MQPNPPNLTAIARQHQANRMAARREGMLAYRNTTTQAKRLAVQSLAEDYQKELAKLKGNRILAATLGRELGRLSQLEGEALLALIGDFTEWLAAFFYLQEGIFSSMQQRCR